MGIQADLPTLESQKSYYFPSKFIFFDENSYYVAAALRGALFRLHILAPYSECHKF